MKMVEEGNTPSVLDGAKQRVSSPVRNQILASGPLASLDTILNIIQQEETHKCVMMERDHCAENTVAFATRKQSIMVEKPTCKHFGKYGHEEANCYELVGYPPNWGSCGRGYGGCEGRAGHGSRTSRGKCRRAGRETAHTTLNQVERTAGSSSTTAESTVASIPSLTFDQVQTLLCLIKVIKPGYD